MKNLRYLSLTLALLAAAAVSAEAQYFRSMSGGFGGEGNSRTVLVIKRDCSCVLTNETTQARKSMEMQVSTWERYSKMADGIGVPDEDEPPALSQAAKDRKPLTNEELAAKLREMYQDRPDSGAEEALKVETVEVSSNSVLLVTTASFASLKDLLSESPYSWGPAILMFEEARAEIDTNHNFRMTFTPNRMTSRYLKNMGREWKSAKMKFEWKLVLPGKILSSGLPNAQETTTWLALDGEKPETIDAATKLIAAPLVITAEAAGMKLDEPLESKKLLRAGGRRQKSESELPITDAAGGFVAEPVGISLSTVHYFPEGEKYFKSRPDYSVLGQNSTGTVVSAKLFPPKGRQIKSVSDVRVKGAKDDKGRSIPGTSERADASEDMRTERYVVMDGLNDSEKSQAARIELQLGLPAPDTKSIDELEGEAVALTIGSWKEMTIPNALADPKKEIDLGEILPGAKMTIKKIGGRKPQKSVQATLEGPKEVNQLEVKIKLGGRHGGQSNMTEQRSATSGSKTTRNITVQAFEFDLDGQGDSGPVNLIVRYPQDMKRERVQFKLTALDLL